MTTEDSELPTAYIPPVYNLRGRRQLWFIETGNELIDNVVNGLVTALHVYALIVVVAAVQGGL